MSIIPDGVYRITKPNDQAATIMIASAPPDPIARVFLLPKTTAKEQDWAVKNLEDGNVTIQNVLTNNYLGYQGKAERGKFCEQIPEPVEWRIQPTEEKGKFHVVVPGGGQGGGYELVFDVSHLLIYPPLTALADLRINDVGQAWGFELQTN